MLEVEVKYPVTDLAALEARLGAEGARFQAARSEADHYFNAPDRDFARSDEALRLRRIGPINFVTYKGPKLDPHTKTRSEIEVRLADGAAAAADFGQLLERLGYRAVAVVRKERRLFLLQRDGFDLEASLDRVAGVGTFVELEIQASEADLETARKVLLHCAAALELHESERRSYLELLLQKTSERA